MWKIRSARASIDSVDTTLGAPLSGMLAACAAGTAAPKVADSSVGIWATSARGFWSISAAVVRGCAAAGASSLWVMVGTASFAWGVIGNWET